MSAQNLTINLLPKDAFESSLIGKMLLWALSVGRYIVVFTELIVILSFLSRFKLDRDLTDLNTEIEQQKAIVLSYGDLEDQINQIQYKLNFLKEVSATEPVPQVSNTLTSLLPPDIRLERLSVNEERFQFEAVALTIESLNQLVVNINSHPQFSNVELNEVASSTDGSVITFSMEAVINQNIQ